MTDRPPDARPDASTALCLNAVPIYVMFALNPDPPAGGPASGFTAFGSVNNLATAQSATVLGANAGNVNCPVVAIGE
jgi:hypothetical protein